MTSALTVGRRRALAAALAAVALLAAVACGNTDDAGSPRVWAVDIDTDADRYGGAYAANRAGDHDEVSLRPAVYATVCAPAVHNFLDVRGGYGHDPCSYPYCCGGSFGAAGWSDGSLDTVDGDHPELRVRALTVTASVRITAEYVTSYSDNGEARTEPVETLWSGEVGPLSMYEPAELGPIVARFDPVEHTPAYDRQKTAVAREHRPVAAPYQIYVAITDCRLSNGSACGNNSKRFYFVPAGEVGTSEQGLGAAGAGLTIPDRAGGLSKLQLGSGQEGGRASQPDQKPVGGVPVRRTVQGLFQAGNGLGRVYFWGVELAEPPPPQSIGAATIKEAFGLGVSSGGVDAPSSEARQYDAGPLGGQVWCQTLKHTLLSTQTRYACGWMDQSTIGTISVSHDAIEDLGLTEADAAALLVQMRSDIETQR
jgi:hypothetical protein